MGGFGPDTFEFPRRERVAASAVEVLTAPIETSDRPGPYRANVVRRKDLVTMRLPHQYRTLSAPNRPTTADLATDVTLASVR